MGAEWRHYCFFTILCLIFIASNCNATAASWWSVGLYEGCIRGEESCPNCAKLGPGDLNVFNSNQAEECSNEPASLKSLSKGSRAAIIDCQSRFSDSRWNCSTLYGDHLFGYFVANSFPRERAVLMAYFSAGAIWALADDCHNQRIPTCPCGQSNAEPEEEPSESDVIFQGCLADFGFAWEFVQKFVIGQLDLNTFGGKIDHHNIKVGKKLLNREISSCRCHGVSGTCTVQTCYTRTPTVKEIGETLFNLYSGAVPVIEDANGDPVVPGNTPPSADALIFSDTSPNFCTTNATVGTTGVGQRKCDLDSNKRNACSTLCCDFGHDTEVRVEPVEECEFIWCCRIDCQITANVTITDYKCRAPHS